ncbi:hypothetical protein HYV81_04415 [Candidatus Woesearchaeota archaeon]|nr:hypothetical protein [Candidatus Woesearchaeota archaeon]
MKTKRIYLYIGGAAIVLLFIIVLYKQFTDNEEQLPEHLRKPLPDYPRPEFINHQKVGQLGSVHEHADIAIYVDGTQLDLSQLRYQLTDKFVHLEEGRGDVLHKHATGVTIGYFLSTLGFAFEGNCITFESRKLCDTTTKKLRVYVNGMLIDNYKDYEFFDLDKILVTYGEGSQEDIDRQLASVTNNARIFSKK